MWTRVDLTAQYITSARKVRSQDFIMGSSWGRGQNQQSHGSWTISANALIRIHIVACSHCTNTSKMLCRDFNWVVTYFYIHIHFGKKIYIYI